MTSSLSHTDDLEPVALVRESGIILRVGTLLLGAGSGSYRVKIAMKQVGRALGIDSVDAQVTVNEITATARRGSIFRTEVAQSRSIGVNAHRIALLEQLCGSLTPGTPQQEISARLDEIEKRPLLYGTWSNALFAAVACAAFAFLNNGGPVEVLVVFFGAGLGQATRRLMLHRGFNQLGVTMLAAAVASVVYLGIVNLLFAVGAVDTIHESGYISAVLFLVPGFPLITAALDLSRLDFSAGVSRLTYALMIMTSAAMSVWAVSAVMGLTPDPAAPLALAPGLTFALRLVASAFGVLGFALMFNSRWRVALAAAGIGMVANVVRLELIDAGVVVQAAACAAGLIVGILANLVAPRMQAPRLTLSVPAVVIMVPGAAAYRAVYFLNDGQTVDALAYGVQAAFVVIALAIGLTIARTVTDGSWRPGGH
ncbi:threonine/serine ThrE exporter family protein [Sanguibacter suarezii]|uniref:threonine/serine ThrE exporter family protein n=1 Tax=Sanguibacter suarezii TaxID=60921 RepID=UPI000836EDCE|nr:threonine/serine exporter family protein [Sanguibacter suarezii]